MADTFYKLATQGMIRVVAQNRDTISYTDHCLTIESAKYQVMIVHYGGREGHTHITFCMTITYTTLFTVLCSGSAFQCCHSLNYTMQTVWFQLFLMYGTT